MSDTTDTPGGLGGGSLGPTPTTGAVGTTPSASTAPSSDLGAGAPKATVVDPSVMEPIAAPPAYGHHGPSFHYSLVSWGSVVAGAVIAVAVGAMLNLLGLAVGVSVLEPGDPGGASAGEYTVLSGIWLLVSTVIGLVVGGYVAARSAADPDHHEGALHGAAVWAVTFLLAFLLTGTLVSGTAFSGIAAAGAAAEDVRGPADRVTDAARGAAAGVRDEDRRDGASERRTEEAADRAADAVSGAAFWGFATMLASLIGAMIGGTIGARHDDSHYPRPRRNYPSVI